MIFDEIDFAWLISLLLVLDPIQCWMFTPTDVVYIKPTNPLTKALETVRYFGHIGYQYTEE